MDATGADPQAEQDSKQAARSQGDADALHESLPRNISTVAFVMTETHALALLALAAIASLLFDALRKQRLEESMGRRQARSYLSKAGNASVDPCDDFHEHVCGGWNENMDEWSFSKEVQAAEKQHKAMALLRYPAMPRQGSRTFSMLSALFKSCHQELRVKHNFPYFASAMLQASNITLGTLRNTSGVGSWLKTAVAMSVVLGLDPLFALTAESRGVRYMLSPAFRLDRTWSEKFAVNSMQAGGLPRHVLVAAFGLQERIAHQKLSDVQWEAATAIGLAKDVFPRVGVGALEDWLRAVNAYVNVSVTRTTPVGIWYLDTLSAILRAFFAVSDATRAAFMYMHILERALDYADASRLPYYDRLAFCVDELNTESLRPALKAFALHSLASRDALSAAHDMYSAISSKTVSALSRLRHLDRDQLAAVRDALTRIVRRSVLDGVVMSASVLDEAYHGYPATPNLYSGISIGRVIPYKGKEMGRRAACLTLFWNSLAFFDGDRLCLLLEGLVPPLFYAGAGDDVNYGSLGFLIALALAEELLEQLGSGSAQQQLALQTLEKEAARCFPEQKTHATHGAAVALAMAAAFGAFTSQAGRDSRDSGSSYRAEQRRMFFKRACLVTCSLTYFTVNRKSILPDAKFACNAAVSATPEFYEAFSCVHTKERNVRACLLFS